MKRLVQWGAGNIGRSFIGQVFSRSGYEVIFIDIDTNLVQLLNSTHRYEVAVVSQEGSQRIPITGVSAVHGGDHQGVLDAIDGTDLISVSVGKQVLPRIAAQLGEALAHRLSLRPDQPVDIIIAENIHEGARFLEGLLTTHMPSWEKFKHRIGLIETSIGKMVPIQTSKDPLVMLAEPYNALIVDREGFVGPLPDCPFLQPVAPIAAYVDRKLYIHNLGHATASYLGFQKHPLTQSLAEVLDDEQVREGTRKAMEQAARILLERYPAVFTSQAIAKHIDDLLHRFRNKALGDTIFRVGRDLGRKLRYDDRLMGAIILAERGGFPWDAIAKAYRAGMGFQATDPQGTPSPQDAQLTKDLQNLSPREAILRVSGLDEAGIGAELRDRILVKLETVER
jgi:mannitol-1-phosphate 5-dehydrogenase